MSRLAWGAAGAVGTGGVGAAVFASGWLVIAVVIVVVGVPAGVLCWILADRDRPARLALVLTAWRHGPQPPPSGLAASSTPLSPH